MGRIKGITVEIDGNVTGLEKALKDVNSIGGELGRVEGYLDVRLCSQIIDFIRPYRADDFHKRGSVGKIAIVQMEVRLPLQVRDPLTVVDRRAADDAMDIISLLHQKLGQVGAVLARYACDQCFLHVLNLHKITVTRCGYSGFGHKNEFSGLGEEDESNILAFHLQYLGFFILLTNHPPQKKTRY